MDLKSFFIFGAFIIDLFLVLYIHFHTRKQKVLTVLEGVAALLAVWSVLFLFYQQRVFTNPEIWLKASYLALSAAFAGILLFSWVYPSERVHKGLAGLLVVFMVAVGGLVLGSNVISDVYAYNIRLVLFFPFFVTFLVSCYIFAWYTLIQKYSVTHIARRLQTSYLLAGLTAILPVMIINILFARSFLSLTWLGPAFGSLALGIWSYALLSPRLKGTRLFLVNTVTYLLMGGILGIVFLSGQALLRQVFMTHESQNESLVMYSILFLGLVLIYQPLKLYLTRIASAIIYKKRFDSDEFLQHVQTVTTSSTQLHELVDGVLGVILNDLQPNFAALLVLHNGQQYFTKYVGEQITFDWKTIVLLGEAARETEEKLILLPELYTPSFQRRYMNEHSIELLLPGTFKKKLQFVLILGPKMADGMYTSDEIEMLKGLPSELVSSMAFALEYEKVVKVNSSLTQEVVTTKQRLKSEQQEVKKLDHVKDEFMSIAAHELRTPLTVIRSYLWMLLQDKAGKLNKKQKMYIERSFTSADRLITNVNDMLSVTRIESGRMSLVKMPTSITLPIKNVVTGMELRAQELSIALKFVQKKDKIPDVEIDSEKIEEVIINLIDNAMKFTPAGGKITISADMDAAKHEVVVKVEDTGIGINKDDMPRLFHKFANTSHDNIHTNVQSTGLGLYICKAIIRMHGGRMWAESDGEGKGTTFFFTIPTE